MRHIIFKSQKNTMKPIKYIGGFLAATMLSLGTVGCTDLDEKTFDRIDASTYYQDENSVKGALAAIYLSAQYGWLEYFWYLNEFPADQIAWRSWNGRAWGWDEAEKFVLSSQTWNSESKIIRDAWEHAWQTIALCNLFIQNLSQLDPGSIGMTQDAIDNYIAEARTMRAWAFYNNFELWGGALPINTSTGGEVPGSASSNFDEGCKLVYNFIMDELDESNSKLPSEDGSGAVRGRLNQGVNRMLKMRLLLNSEIFIKENRYSECADLCQEIIDGKYGNYSIAGDYRQIFSMGNNACPEIVFAFSEEVGHANVTNCRNTPFLPYNYDEFTGFTCDQGGWNCTMVVPSKDNSGTLVPYAGTANPKSFIFDYGDKLGAPYDRMNDKDIRKQPFHCDAAGNWQGRFFMGAQLNYSTAAPVLADADLQDKPLTYVDQCGTFLNLGRQLETVMSPRWGETNSGFRIINYPIYPASVGYDWRDISEVEFRLAEVYYTLAECRLREGNSAKAKDLVNQVRQRYFTGAAMAEIEKPGPGFNAFDADWMLSEWGLEFLNEGRRRRTDLRRFDKFTQGQWWFFGRATEPDRPVPAKRDRKYEWYPLPQSALMVNPGLHQNPNY